MQIFHPGVFPGRSTLAFRTTFTKDIFVYDELFAFCRFAIFPFFRHKVRAETRFFTPMYEYTIPCSTHFAKDIFSYGAPDVFEPLFY